MINIMINKSNSIKICRYCKKEKNITEFSKHKEMKDGRLNRCRDCTNLYNRNYEKTEIGKVRKHFWHKKYNLKYPNKTRAVSIVSYQIKIGNLEKKPCIKCNKIAHAHHDDYSKPLDVIWLCPIHHKERHFELDAKNHDYKY